MGVRFSPDGCLITTATCDSVRVYDSQDGSLLVEFPVGVNSSLNYSLAWAGNSLHKQLFVLSDDGYIHHVDVSAGTTLSKWHIHSTDKPKCIALASNGKFIAASADSSASFWDTTSQEQIGTVIEYTHRIASMAMSSNYDLVTSGGKKITLQTLWHPSLLLLGQCKCITKITGNCKPLHSPFQTSRMLEIQKTKVDKVDDSPGTFNAP